MKNSRLIATKSLKYGTRRLLANDEFMATGRDARILIAIGKARAARQPGKLDPPPAGLLKKIAPGGDGNNPSPGSGEDKDHMAALRAKYSEVIGRRPFPGWDADELQKRIDEAAGS